MRTIKIIILGLLIAAFLFIVAHTASAAITYNAGTNLITLTGDGASPAGGTSWANAYDMEDVLSNCGAVVTKQGANAYDVSARMLFQPGVYFVSINEFVELKPSPANCVYTIRAEAGSHIRIGEYDTVNGYSHSGAFWQVYLQSTTGSQSSTGNRLMGEFLLYGSNFICDSTHYTRGPHFVSGATIRVYNSICKWAGYFWAEDCDMQDVKWHGGGGQYDMLVACGLTHAWGGLTTMGCGYGIFFSGTTTGNVDVYDFKPLDATNFDVMISTGIPAAWLVRVINSPYAVTCSTPGSGKKGVQFCYTFNVKVTNDVGTPIIGATVSLKDVDGANAFDPVQTIAGGVLPNDEIVKWYWFRHANDGGNKDYNDHTLKVTNGADETEYKIKIDHQITEDVVLIPQSVASYDNIMDALNDIKGGGFTEANDSLYNISNKIDDIDDYPSLTIKATTGAFYSLDSDMAIFIIVQDNNNNLTSATITVSIYNETGVEVSTGNAVMVATGRYQYTFSIPYDATLCTYRVDVNATDGTNTAYDTTSFVTSGNLPFIIEEDGTIIIKKSGFSLMALFSIPAALYYFYRRKKKKLSV